MRKDSFYKNSFILTSSNITTGVLGFIFSIYLSKKLGPEGVGLYGLVMPVYNLFIGLMTAGIIAAISKVSALYHNKGDYPNLIKTLRTVAFFNLIWAAIIGLLVFAFAPMIGTYGVHDERTIDAIKITCPAMFCIAVSNILKGYFYGISKVTMPSFIDILEKAMRIFVLIGLIYLFNAQSLSALVTVAYLALCIGEFQSLALLFVYYKFTLMGVKTTGGKTEGRAQLLFDVLFVSIPLGVNGFLTSIFSTISTLIVPRRLMVAGFTYSASLSLIGKFNGMAFVIVTFPIIVIASINSLLIPDLSQSLHSKEYFNVYRRIKQVLIIAFLLGLCTLLICQTIPDLLGEMFFSRDDLGSFIRSASICTPILFPAITMFGILNGLGKQGKILRNSLIVELIEITSLFILTAIPSINILGVAIANVITATVGLSLNLYEVNKSIKLNLSISNILILLLFFVLALFSLNLFLRVVPFDGAMFKTLTTVGSCVILFLFLLFANRKLQED
ncbi:stage V sporulation protein B [Clostridium paridis]|uniref:Multidrug-efflux transporter n=1 Tax=Clostridium paridis TaxID=2803863 RepID=A0A937FHW9_9CLOT|nr:stage V sporulation protein B [Clostridium paridis]MBL4932358.1 stage V sporulation protein B [Clostridium paridis]